MKTKRNDTSKSDQPKAINRREFFKDGATAGIGAVALTYLGSEKAGAETKPVFYLT